MGAKLNMVRKLKEPKFGPHVLNTDQIFLKATIST